MYIYIHLPIYYFIKLSVTVIFVDSYCRIAPYVFRIIEYYNINHIMLVSKCKDVEPYHDCRRNRNMS